jgi:hypothetical protein
MEWMKGKKTYILGGIMFVQALVSFLVGEISMVEFFAEVPELVGGLGLISLRAGISSSG